MVVHFGSARRRAGRFGEGARAATAAVVLALGVGVGAWAEDVDLIAPRVSPLATEPTTAPVVRSKTSEELAGLFRDLADVDGAVRDRAREQLIGMAPSDLEGLKRVVAGARPLAPSQSAVLREIVTHVYLSGRTYASSTRAGFLGVSFDDFQVVREADEEGPRYGVVVTGRLPGFVGYRALQDGDVITHVDHQPFASRTDFSTAIQQFKAGSVVTLDVLRQGRQVRVTVRLDLRPIWAEDFQTIKQGQQEREDEAEAYWVRNFEPLVAARAG